MARGMIITLFIIIAAVLVLEFAAGNAGAQDTGGYGQVLRNQKLILEKLEALDKKLDVIKIRVSRR